MDNVRLIDANPIEATPIYTTSCNEDYVSGYLDGANAVMSMVHNAPTIDPASLQPRASWTRPAELKMIIPARKLHGESVLKCSRCGCMISETGYKLYVWNYCPVCGSKMEG